MKLANYLNDRGKQTELASKIGCSIVTIHQIKEGTLAPSVKMAVAIERATGGAVTRKDLRPLDWQDIWPELSQSLNGQGRQDAGANSLADKPELAERGEG